MNEKPITNSPIVPPADPSATPMIQQYIEIKSANADSLLFYRMGDFYELFFGDAEIAAKALSITLTKRGKHAGKEIPMCGVPVHAADDYLHKLIALGFKVAVCEQTEDPAEAKKRGSKAVVRRDVVRLVTPGTVTEEAILNPRENAWMAALARQKTSSGLGQLALARIDLSTGSFEVFSTDESRLISDLLSFEPRELVLSDAVFQSEDFCLMREQIEQSGCALTPEHKSLFDSSSAERRLSDFYGVGTMDGLGGFSRVELTAASAALSYVLKTQVNARPVLDGPKPISDNSVLGLDAATRTNLELARTLTGERKGSLLHAIDRTVTAAGGRLLADHLRAPLCDVSAIDERLDAASFFLAESNLRSHLRNKLSQNGDMARALSRLALDRGGPRDLKAIGEAIGEAKKIAIWLPESITQMATSDLPKLVSQALAQLAALPSDLEHELKIALSEDVPLLARDGGFVRKGYRLELDELRQLRDESRQVIAQLQTQYAEQTGVKNLKIKYNNVLGYFIEVTALNAEALTGSDEAKAVFIHRQTLANAMRFTTTELADLESRIASAAGRALQIEQEVFTRLVAIVKEQDAAIRSAANALAALDVLASHAELAESEGYCRPKIDDSMKFEVVAARHPVVEQALRAQAAHPFVANNCDLSASQGASLGQIWLLTGPNMGGKSTLLRQNALIAIMAQMGAYVPAGSAHIGLFDRIFSRVGAADDLARGRSTFMVEMVETAAILNQATERSLVILDEIGRGTATYDGLSIAWASLEALHESNCARAIFATHYHELTALADNYERLHNVTMAVKEFEGEVIFLHEVRAGAADRSYGIQVAQLAGLPQAVIARARIVLSELEKAQTESGSAGLIDELPLFSAAVIKSPAEPPLNGELRQAVEDLDPDDMSPRDALKALYQLKSLL